MSILPIQSFALSSTILSRGLNVSRPFGGSSEETSKTQSSELSGTDSQSAVHSSSNTIVQPTGRSDKSSADRSDKSSSYPEKSTDSGKTRSASGDVLDLSSETKGEQGTETGSRSIASGKLQEESQSADSKMKDSSEKSEKKSTTAQSDLSDEEQQQLQELKARDLEVRAHEAAHLAAAGQYAQGGPSFTYQTGPDGKKYAIGGEVSIDSGPISGDPQATIQKAQQVRAAALAPASPSSQDQKVAAAASRMEADARIQLSRQKADEANGLGSEESDKAALASDSEQENSVAATDDSETSSAKQSVDSLRKWTDAAKKSQSQSVSVNFNTSTLGSGQVVSEYLRNQIDSGPRREFVAYA